jgi:heme/copper-type cytochrome/quinol oxidase subunit 4
MSVDDLDSFGRPIDDSAGATLTTASSATSVAFVDGSDEFYDDLDDTRLIPYPGCVKQVAVTEAAAKIATYSVAIVMSVIGNLAVIVTVACRRSMHTTTNYYLVNLAVSDLAVTLSCSWVHLVSDLTEGWILGSFFCKANSFVQGQNVINRFSVLTVDSD